MPDQYETRDLRESDIPALSTIADDTLFPGETLGEMVAPALAGESEDVWRVVSRGGALVGFAMAQPEPMTDCTWNLRAIAVSPELHGGGAGSVLLSAMEAAMSARLIVIDTTQLPEQDRARQFYTARGYTHVSTIPEFFGAGEDKVTFVKFVDEARR
ncbi:GNAT family N-acetyltransferase [Tateyamaria sp. Alg231-49]|uniref:GNAT family N-acetyltransferase n=1 Tax=Tateyamaria sp. Alg231-49 TaxID=1922219 RepID=UPI00131ED5EF|nr:GNAT family N-acetyltransferase [Tateyamaria sp. Alg231-49]